MFGLYLDSDPTPLMNYIASLLEQGPLATIANVGDLSPVIESRLPSLAKAWGLRLEFRDHGQIAVFSRDSRSLDGITAAR